MIDCLLSMLENLGLILNTEKKNEKEGVWAVIFLWEGQCRSVLWVCSIRGCTGTVLSGAV